MGDTMQQRLTQDLTQFLASLPEDDRIKAINEIRMAIHQVSPFREEPVDCVLWVKNSQLMPNDYNPNNVAPPEKKLLKKSIEIDGFTQPIVVTHTDKNALEIVDGFHRHEIGKGSSSLKLRLKGYLPVTCLEVRVINASPRLFVIIALVDAIKSPPCRKSSVNLASWDGTIIKLAKSWEWTATKCCA